MFYFHPYLGKVSILTNIFQRGWNHELDDNDDNNDNNDNTDDNDNNKTPFTRWFKVTFSSPDWRSLNPLKGSLNHPKKVTLNNQADGFFSEVSEV